MPLAKEALSMQDRLERVFTLRREGFSIAEIGEELHVTPSTVNKYIRRLRDDGYDLGEQDRERNVRGQLRNASRSDDRAVESAETRLKALTMRLEGHRSPQIAATLGISPQAVRQHLAAALGELITPKAEELRQLELERLDHLLLKLCEGIDNGDVPSIKTAISISERRSVLLGLNKAVQVQHTVISEDSVDAEIRRLVEKLEEMGVKPPPLPGHIDGEVIENAPE